jgi:clan AA aspartic protease (TIGR02281 family)
VLKKTLPPLIAALCVGLGGALAYAENLYGTNMDDFINASDRYARPRSVEEYRRVVPVETDKYGMCRNAAHLDQCVWRLNGNQYPPPNGLLANAANSAFPKPIACVGIFNTYATRDGQELSYDSYKKDTAGDSISSIKGEDGDYICYVLWGGAGHSPFKGVCEDKQRCRVVGTYRKRVGNAYFVDYTDAHSIDGRGLEGDRTGPSTRQVPMQKVGGIYVVPVEINGAITLDFTIDTGAADVSIPLDVFSTLRRKGTIQDADIIGEQTYVLANGSTQKTFTFTIRSLRVGDIVIENVRSGVAPLQGSLLLGQSFLERFESWSVDNAKHVLLLGPRQASP